MVFLGGVFGAAESGVAAGTTALVCALQPMLVTAAGGLWWGDRVPHRARLGLLLGLAAVALTVGGSLRGGDLGQPALALPVASMLGLCAAALLERRWGGRPRSGPDPAISPVRQLSTGLWVQVSVAALAFTTYAATTGRLTVTPDARFWAAIAWLVVLSGIGGYVCFLTCLRRLGATATSTLLYLTPPVTTVWVWLMFGERP